MMFLGVALYWLESLFYSLEGMQPLVLPLAALAAPLPALFPGLASSGAHAAAAEFKLHLALAMIAYGLFVDRAAARRADGGRRAAACTARARVAFPQPAAAADARDAAVPHDRRGVRASSR